VDRPYLELAALRNLVFVLGATLPEEHLDEAETLLQRIIEGGDDAPDTCLWNHFLRGIIYGSRSNYEAAAEAFQATLEVAEENPDVRNDENTNEALCWARAILKTHCGKGGAPSVAAVVDMVLACERGEPAVLEWESRLEELLATTQQRQHPDLIEAFVTAYARQGRLAEAVSLYERRVKVWEALERFREQVSDMCNVGNLHVSLNVPATPSPTRNPKPETRNPKLETRNPKPEIRNPKPKT
jgi:tetratricopeptide (TPR) repeat protein